MRNKAKPHPPSSQLAAHLVEIISLGSSVVGCDLMSSAPEVLVFVQRAFQDSQIDPISIFRALTSVPNSSTSPEKTSVGCNVMLDIVEFFPEQPFLDLCKNHLKRPKPLVVNLGSVWAVCVLNEEPLLSVVKGSVVTRHHLKWLLWKETCVNTEGSGFSMRQGVHIEWQRVTSLGSIQGFYRSPLTTYHMEVSAKFALQISFVIFGMKHLTLLVWWIPRNAHLNLDPTSQIPPLSV